MTFSVIGTPVPQGSMKALNNRKTGRTMLISDNPALKAWRELVGIRAKCAMDGKRPFTGALKLSVSFYFKKPPSVKREHITVKPDLDKCLRGIFDAMTGIIYLDDAQIVIVSECRKIYVHDTAAPGATITVEEL